MINSIDPTRIYTLTILFNRTRSFPKKKERKKKEREKPNLEREKTRNWQSLVVPGREKKREAISREFGADKKKKKEIKKNSETTPILSRLFLKRECNRETGRKKRRWRAKGGLKGWQRERKRRRERKGGRKDKEGKIKTKACRGGARGESESRFHYFISKAERCGDNGPPPEGWHDRKPRDISIVSNANSENETWNRWLRTKGNGIAKSIAIRLLPSRLLFLSSRLTFR